MYQITIGLNNDVDLNWIRWLDIIHLILFLFVIKNKFLPWTIYSFVCDYHRWKNILYIILYLKNVHAHQFQQDWYCSKLTKQLRKHIELFKLLLRKAKLYLLLTYGLFILLYWNHYNLHLSRNVRTASSTVKFPTIPLRSVRVRFRKTLCTATNMICCSNATNMILCCDTIPRSCDKSEELFTLYFLFFLIFF